MRDRWEDYERLFRCSDSLARKSVHKCLLGSDHDRTTGKEWFENIKGAELIYELIRSIQAGDAVEPV